MSNKNQTKRLENPTNEVLTKFPHFICVVAIGAALWLSGGCASHYNITTTGGYTITSTTKPHLNKETSTWTYKDPSGRMRFISAGSVTEVSPASMSEPETSKTYQRATK